MTAPIENFEDSVLSDFERLSLHSERRNRSCEDTPRISKEDLEELECPFTWEPSHVPPEDTPDEMIRKISEKLEETKEGDKLSWRQFVSIRALCYEYYRKKNLKKALEQCEECEHILKESIDNEAFKSLPNAAEHVLLASKVFVLNAVGKISKARSLLKEIVAYEDLSTAEQAGIWGIKASLHMEYGYKGTKEAIGFSKMSISLNPREGHWHFLLGKCLGRIRRIESRLDIPSNEELDALETAVELDPNPKYIIFTAEAYMEASFRAFSKHRNNLGPLKSVLNELNKKSALFYKLALEGNKECSHMNIRCAKGFLRLPYPYKDPRRAKQCLDKALAIAPNNAMAHHQLGSYFEYQHNDVERAMASYKKAGECGAYGAYMDLFRLKYGVDNTYNPIPDLESLLERFQEKPRLIETRVQMVSYYLIIKNDLKSAAIIWKDVLDSSPDISKLNVSMNPFYFIFINRNLQREGEREREVLFYATVYV